jgi:hypothetical protein
MPSGCASGCSSSPGSAAGEQQRAGRVSQHQGVGQLSRIQITRLRAVEAHHTQMDRTDLKRQREHRTDPGVHGGRRENRPAGQALRSAQVGDQRRATGEGIHPRALTEGQGQLLQLRGDPIAGVDGFAGYGGQHHRDGDAINPSSRHHRGTDMLDRGRCTQSVVDDQAPQPHPPIDGHRSAPPARHTDDEITTAASDASTVREAATGG